MNSKLAAFLAILNQVAPVVLAAVPATRDLAPFIIKGIAAAEQIPGATGPQKKAAALALTGEVADALSAKGVLLERGTTEANVSAAIDTVVGIVNQVHALHTPAPNAVTPTA